MGKVFYAGGKAEMKKPNNFPKNFADATWEQIVEACQTNAVPDEWAVGDQKTMTVYQSNKIYTRDYTIDIIGKNHDVYADGSGTAPLTFQFHESLYDNYRMLNVASTSVYSYWENSTMRETYLPEFMELMPIEVQNAIKEVSKASYYKAGVLDSYTTGTTSDKLFVLAYGEVFGTSGTYYRETEGSQYEYYAAGNSKVKCRYSYTNGYAWWTRTQTNQGYYGIVPNGGTDAASNYLACNSDYVAVAPAFCF